MNYLHTYISIHGARDVKSRFLKPSVIRLSQYLKGAPYLRGASYYLSIISKLFFFPS